MTDWLGHVVDITLSEEEEEEEEDARISAAAEYKDEDGSLEEGREGDEFVLTWVNNSGERTEVLRFATNEGVVRIWPRSLSLGQLEEQFTQVTELQIEAPDWDPSAHSTEHDRYPVWQVRGLPRGFAAVYVWGLGIKRNYRGLVRQIEDETGCTVVRFVRAGAEGPDPDERIFRITLDRFERYRAAVDRNKRRAENVAQRVNFTEARNSVADLFGRAHEEPQYGKNPTIRGMTEEVATGHVTSAADRTVLVDEVARAAPKIAREDPDRLGQLRGDIELVTLEVLIERFAAGLEGGKSMNEPFWQDFFDHNRFALQQIFSTPIVVRRAQATVGGAGLDGTGERITDFLCINPVTHTGVVVEIKTPATPLVHSKPYRGSKGSPRAVYAPHRELTSAVSQAQSHLESAAIELPSRLHRGENFDLARDVRCAVIAGRIGTLQGAELESYLRYRSGLANVTVLGYDEILTHLRALHETLQNGSSTEESPTTS